VQPLLVVAHRDHSPRFEAVECHADENRRQADGFWFGEVTAFLFGLIRYHGQVLEQETARSRQKLGARDLQLEKLTSALSNQARTRTSAIEVNARLLLQNYGGFLPRQGHEYAEQIREASAQMELLRQDLVGSPCPSGDERAA
jgi:hypothetical protein